MSSQSKWIDYAKSCIAGNSGLLIRLAAERFIRDLESPLFEFRENEVNRCLSFISHFKHYTGVHSGKTVELADWLIFIIANIIGFYWKNSNRRRFTQSYIEVARKNGKSFLAAVLCIYFLVADKENGAEVLLAANSKELAKIAFNMCSVLAGLLDYSGRVLRCYRSEIQFQRTNSSLKCLAADDSKLDGFNASFGLIDEYHSAKNSRVRDVIKSSMGMRISPHLCTITTAGFDKSLPCYELRQTNVDILKGLKTDESTFVAIYSLDENDDWKDENVWSKANPNLGVTVYKEYLRDLIRTAINNVSELIGVKTKNLNIWCDTSNVWVSDVEVTKAIKLVDWSEFKGQLVFIGVDLAATSDLTAVTYMTIKDLRYIFKTEYYLPSSALDTGVNALNYQLWSSLGFLKITDGNVTDYDRITNDIKEHCLDFYLVNVAYDSWNATQWAIDCTAKGFPLNPFSQTIGNFNRPTKEFERLILGGNVTIDNNPVTRFCFSNVVIKMDSNGNTKPTKEDRNRKIDGVIAMLMSLGGYLQNPLFGVLIYSI